MWERVKTPTHPFLFPCNVHQATRLSGLFPSLEKPTIWKVFSSCGVLRGPEDELRVLNGGMKDLAE